MKFSTRFASRSEDVLAEIVGVETFNLIVCHILNCTKVCALFRGYDRHSGSFLSCSSGSTDPVEVCVRILGNIVIDYMRDSLDIQASAR